MLRRSWLKSDWSIAGLFALTTIILLSGVLISHSTTFFTNLDNVDQFYTWYQKLAVSLHHGFLPIWNSNVFSGQSFAGELQPGVFYPLNIIWVALFGGAAGISVQALDWLVALHFAIAGFGAYLVFKEFGAQRWSSYLAGLTYAFSGAVAFRSINQTVIFFGLALLPYPLYFLAKYHMASKSRWWLVGAGVFLGLIILSGHIDPFYFAFLALVIYELTLIYRGFKVWNKLWPAAWAATRRLLIVLAAAIVVALPQLILSAQYLPHSYRVQAGGYESFSHKIPYGDFSKAFSINIHEFLGGMIDPTGYQIRDGNDLFIGLLPLGIVMIALWLGRARLKATKLWRNSGALASSMMVLGIVAALGYVTWLAVLLYELPLVYDVRQLGRYIIFFHLGLMFVLAAALEAVQGQKFSKKQKTIVGLTGAFLLINSLYLFLLRDRIFNLHFSLQFALLALGLLSIMLVDKGWIKKYLLISLLIVTAYVNGLWFLPNIKSDTETTSTYNLSPSVINTLEKTNGQYRVEIASGLPINTGNIYKVQTTGGYGATIYAPYYDFIHDSHLSQDFVRDLLGVKLVVTGQDGRVNIAQRQTMLPKMFTAQKAGSISRADYLPMSVKTLSYNDQHQKYSLKADKSGQVILSEISYPGWKLWVDGKSVKLDSYSIDSIKILKAFNVSAGLHTVELKYQPFI